MPIQITTPLPDEDQPTLNNGIEDEITVDRGAAVSNYKDVRYQIQETDQGAFAPGNVGFAEKVVSPSTTSITFGGLEDGEEYEARGRTESEHITGAFTSPEQVVTAFPTPTNLSATVVSATQVDLSWDDQADNEDGFRVKRRREFADGTLSAFQTLTTLPPDTETFTDDTVSPGATLDYRVEAFTEDATTATDVSVTTPNIATTTPTSADSWSVEIDHPSGTTIRPDPLAGVEFRPRVNGLPTVRIPVRQDDRYNASAYEDRPMRVFFEGQRVPIDTLITVEQSPEQTVLVGRGGQELLGRVQREVQQQESHLLVRDIVQSETTYQDNVDDPAGNVSEDVLQSVDSETDWRNALKSSSQSLPLERGGGGSLFTRQSLVFREAENSDVGAGGGTVSGSRFNGSEAVTLSQINHNVGFDVGFDYGFATGNLGIQLLFEYPGPDQQNPEITVTLANQQVAQITANALSQDSGPEWTSLSVNGQNLPFSSWPDGTRQLDVEISQSTGEQINLDSVAIFDNRFKYNFATPSNGSAPGPELFPDEISAETNLVNSAFGLKSAELDANFNDTSNKQEVAIRAGSQTNFTTADNSQTVSTTFASNKTAVQARFTLSRFSDGRSTTPTQGNQGQVVTDYQLLADVDETPLILNETFDGRGIDILRRIADRGDFIFELTFDDQADNFELQFTKPGQRTADNVGDPSGFDAAKSTAEQVEQIVVRGGGQRIQAEEVVANHGTFVSLDESPIVQGSVALQDAISGTSFSEGQDFVLRRQTGEIKTLSTGNIQNGNTLEVTYDFKVVGSVATPTFDASADQTRVLDLPGLPTAQACEQTALFLFRELSQPQHTVAVDLTREPTDRSLVNAREFAAVPTGGQKHVVDLTETPSGTQLQLANRRRVSEALSDIEDRVEQLSERA